MTTGIVEQLLPGSFNVVDKASQNGNPGIPLLLTGAGINDADDGCSSHLIQAPSRCLSKCQYGFEVMNKKVELTLSRQKGDTMAGTRTWVKLMKTDEVIPCCTLLRYAFGDIIDEG